MPKTITVNNIEYDISDLDEETKKLITIYQEWKQESIDVIVKARKEQLKCEIACRETAREIESRVTKSNQTEAVVTVVYSDKTPH